MFGFECLDIKFVPFQLSAQFSGTRARTLNGQHDKYMEMHVKKMNISSDHYGQKHFLITDDALNLLRF